MKLINLVVLTLLLALPVTGFCGIAESFKQKNIIAANRTRDDVVNVFGGEEKFYKVDFSIPENFNKAHPYIAAIEKLMGTKRSAEDNKSIHEIRQLIALAGLAKAMPASAVGIFDNVFSNVKKYLFGNVSDVKARSAYLAIQNTFMHALLGSAMTKIEIKKIERSAGKLGQQLAPVLQQLNVVLLQTRAKLDSIYRSGDPIISKVRLDADRKKLNNIINAIDDRIVYITTGRLPESSGPISAENQAIFDEIWNEHMQNQNKNKVDSLEPPNIK